MSHFCGLIILTPEYAKEHTMAESLEKFNENIELPEYRVGVVSDESKVSFMEYYDRDHLTVAFKKNFIAFMRKKKGFITRKAFFEQFPRAVKDGLTGYFNYLCCTNRNRYTEFFKANTLGFNIKFEELYKEKGEDWNGKNWRKENGDWVEYSTSNPDAKYDYYVVGGRWDDSIKKYDGSYTNICKLGEVDLEPFGEDCYEDGEDWLGNPCKQLKDGYEWHYSKNEAPYCVVIDGVWHQRGQMGWFGMSDNEKEESVWTDEFTKLIETLSPNSDTYNVDFHI